mgnify:CR=1 FL=1
MGASDEIAVIDRIHWAPLAMQNAGDFRETDVVLVDSWRG